MKIHNTRGFTVLELMIATMVFSTLLVIATSAITYISRLYYKGYINSRTQETARSIIDDLSRAIQFSGDDIAQSQVANPGTFARTGLGFFCIGKTQYNYVIGKKVDASPSGATETSDALSSQTVTNCDTPSTMTPGERQYLPINSRIANLSVTEANGLYTITIRIVHGDDDLLCSDSVTIAGVPSCNSSTKMPFTATDISNYQKSDLRCKNKTGSQFCAVSELTTKVSRLYN